MQGLGEKCAVSGGPYQPCDPGQAVEDGYLVDFRSLETTLKFVSEGIAYDQLSDEDKEQYEDTFTDEDGVLPDRIESSALNEWLFNEDTIRKVLDTLMIRVNYGNKLGKSIVFAKNHRHAEKILEIFNRGYPAYVGWAQVIDNKTRYARSAIDQFSAPAKLPQIAISVDMLDTGIDVPEVVNLVFFKKVMSRDKFWQMIGRGTRLCPGDCWTVRTRSASMSSISAIISPFSGRIPRERTRFSSSLSRSGCST